MPQAFSAANRSLIADPPPAPAALCRALRVARLALRGNSPAVLAPSIRPAPRPAVMPVLAVPELRAPVLVSLLVLALARPVPVVRPVRVALRAQHRPAKLLVRSAHLHAAVVDVLSIRRPKKAR